MGKSKAPTITIGKTFGQMKVGRKYFEVAGVVYRVGDFIRGMRFYLDENGKEYFEADAKLTSTNVRKQTASFRAVGPLVKK